MTAKVETFKFVTEDMKKVTSITQEVCITYNASFVSLFVVKTKAGFVCTFNYLYYV